MENPHFQWENPLLMAIFNSYFDITRGYIVAQCVFLFKTCPDLVARRRLEDGATSQAEAHGYNGCPPFRVTLLNILYSYPLVNKHSY